MDSTIVLILAATIVIIVVVYLLRDRITGAKASVSLDERKASAEFKAAPPTRETGNAGSPKQSQSPRTGFVGNVARWWSKIRAPEGTRVVDNEASFGSSIEVIPREQPSTDLEVSTKKRKR